MPHTHISGRVRPHETAQRSTEILRMHQADMQLITELYEKQPPTTYLEHVELHAQNDAFAQLIKENYTAEELDHFERLLHEQGTTTVSTIDGYTVTIDGVEQPISFVAATEITDDTPNHGEMASMLYLRDHIQTASVLMELSLNEPKRYKEEAKQGKTLLMSALHLMSTPAQLNRFNNVIQNGDVSQEDWPHISLLFNDLEGEKPNGWRNKQDTFQMLAYLACDGLERGFITPDELSPSHKAFLGSVAPFLNAIGFPKYESSGSWEEIAARRTSVMAVETALLDKIVSLTATNEDMAFLRGALSADEVADMRHSGLKEIGRRLPFESPDYPEESIKHRKADAALAYVLMYDIPKLLADEAVPTGPLGETMSERAIEDMVLRELFTLIDPKTGGMRRYDGDSYQRVNFHTEEVQATIATVKDIVKKEAGGGEINLDKKQSLRDELTPPGKEAAWTHPLGQLAGWAAKRSMRARKSGRPADAEDYRQLSTCFFNHMIANVTGTEQWHAVLNDKKHYVIKKVPSARLPECSVAYELPGGEVFVVPSPHTPLNWSSAAAKEAAGLLRLCTVLQ